MRLFRRSLLCLVVGVTAFGVAGWILRLKPTWTVPLPGGWYYSFPITGGPLNDAGPIWLEVTHDTNHLDEDNQLLAIDAATGAALRRFAQPRADNHEYFFYTLS